MSWNWPYKNQPNNSLHPNLLPTNPNLSSQLLNSLQDPLYTYGVPSKFPRPSFDDSRPTQHPMYLPNPLANPEPQSTPLPTLQNIPPRRDNAVSRAQFHNLSVCPGFSGKLGLAGRHQQERRRGQAASKLLRRPVVAEIRFRHPIQTSLGWSDQKIPHGLFDVPTAEETVL